MKKRDRRIYTDELSEEEAVPVVPCWLCERPMGSQMVWHHPIPKSRGGKDTVPIHPICQNALQSNFTNSELARIGMDVEFLRRAEPVAKFIAWVDGKDPDFNAPTAKKAKR
jgi:hypothetical protein